MDVYQVTIALLVGLFTLNLVLLRRHYQAKKRSQREVVLNSLGLSAKSANAERKRFIGFFHPYCNAGGGGERVLWTAISFLQRTEGDIINVVFSGDRGVTKEDIIENVKARFNIELASESLHFVFLKSRHFVEDATWPRFTLLGQSLGSLYLAYEALSTFVPDLYIDTMGYAFTFYPVRLIWGIDVGAYVHYPTISTDMLHRVRSRTTWHTNSASISSSATLSWGKLLYYRTLMFYYSKSLHNASFLMVNSTWTKNHVDAILNYENRDVLLSSIHAIFAPLSFVFRISTGIKRPPPCSTSIVYPPCDTEQISSFPLVRRDRTILSIAQFRPEKDHAAQLYSIFELFKAHPEYRAGERRVNLVLLGSSRNADDAMRVESLKRLSVSLGIEANVEFVVNAPYPTLLTHLSRASIGVSTMVDEHFGINIVEFMAAGLIPLVHSSGGPLHDIVVPRDGQPTGYHCTTPETFAESIHGALSLSPQEDLTMRQNARKHAVERFSAREFEKGWEAGGWKQWTGQRRT